MKKTNKILVKSPNEKPINKILLDTHVLVWLAVGRGVGLQSVKLFHNADTVLVSTLSLLELRVKQSAGKLTGVDAIASSISQMGIEVLDFTLKHSDGYINFSKENKDPFDIALISVAITEKIPLLTADKQILELKIPGLDVIDAKK